MDVTLLEVELNGGEFTANAPLSFVGETEQTDEMAGDESATDVSGERNKDSTSTGSSKRRLLVGLVVFSIAAVLAYYFAGGSTTETDTDADDS
ncbi:MAG: hypothetical protein J07HX5_01229 [halophilic archaeon J07HX5]|jgi:hypothetical protein|nr:MAG: hypothetical protein J07HX5_01229 [halophilic archaeon J07HX5]